MPCPSHDCFFKFREAFCDGPPPSPPGPPGPPDPPDPAVLSLKLLHNSTYCLDGSPAGYYLSINATSDVWVISMQGGGSCDSVDACTQRAQTTLGSSRSWEPTMEASNTLSRDCSFNPDFCAANHAFVRYCSADGHRGQQNASPYRPSGGGAPFHFAGHLNFEAIVNDLKVSHGLGGRGQQVLLTGCSAGGAGTLTNADTLTDMLPAAAAVKAAPMSGWFWPGLSEDHSQADGWCSPSKFPDYNAGRPTNCSMIEGNYRGLIGLYDAYPHPACVAALGASSSWKCYTMHVSAQYIRTPLFIAENRFDSVQINGDGELPPAQRDTAAGKAFLAYYGRAMNASLQQFSQREGGASDALFVPSCFEHCTDMGLSDKLQVNGVRLAEALGSWFFERGAVPRVLADDCGDAPCNPTCAAFESVAQTHAQTS